MELSATPVNPLIYDLHPGADLKIVAPWTQNKSLRMSYGSRNLGDSRSIYQEAGSPSGNGNIMKIS
jgi:hypothetical protein